MAELLSGQITVTTAGTAVQGPTSPKGMVFAVKSHPDNTDTVWVGNDGSDDVSSVTGFPLNVGEGAAYELTIEGVEVASGINLSALWFDADVSGEKICWTRLK